jgi:hypothetical protein
MRSEDPHAFVIVNVAHSEDFLQLSGDRNSVQVDFPLITPRQRSLEGTIRDVAEHEGLDVVETSGSDGSRFLDVNVNGDYRAVAAICSKILRGVYSLSGHVELKFEHVGLASVRVC